MLDVEGSKQSYEECLLSSDERSEVILYGESIRKTSGVSKSRSTIMLALLLMSMLSVLLNLVQFTHYQSYRGFGQLEEKVFSGLPFDTPIMYHSETEYWGEDQELADRLWAGLNTDALTIALSLDYARERGLAETDRFPWDDEKGVYVVKAIHDIHCLKVMRRFGRDIYFEGNSTVTLHHFEHCLDALRQDIMCRADDTPMAANRNRIGPGDTDIMQCRDWNKLIEWTQAPKQNACHRLIDDFNTDKHTLERFAFCPEWSPYREVQQAYFEKWGHQLSLNDSRKPVNL